MAESDSSALQKELEVEHQASYRGFLRVTQIAIVFLVVLLSLMAIFLV
jgi:hypothetical protein